MTPRRYPADHPALHRSNDDFLLHYGFVPAGNVHDDFIIFDSVDEALQWHRAKFPLTVPDITTLRLLQTSKKASTHLRLWRRTRKTQRLLTTHTRWRSRPRFTRSKAARQLAAAAQIIPHASGCALREVEWRLTSNISSWIFASAQLHNGVGRSCTLTVEWTRRSWTRLRVCGALFCLRMNS